jgi:hypothetical protein
MLQATIQSTDYPLCSVWRYYCKRLSAVLYFVSRYYNRLSAVLYVYSVCLAMLQAAVCSTLPVDMLAGGLVCGFVGVSF